MGVTLRKFFDGGKIIRVLYKKNICILYTWKKTYIFADMYVKGWGGGLAKNVIHWKAPPQEETKNSWLASQDILWKFSIHINLKHTLFLLFWSWTYGGSANVKACLFKVWKKNITINTFRKTNIIFPFVHPPTCKEQIIGKGV